MSTLPPGTVCFLVRLGDFGHLNGRCVEIVSGPSVAMADSQTPSDVEPGCDWYFYRSEWVGAEFPGRLMQARRANFLPLTPPAEPTVARTPEAVTGEA